MPKRNNIPSWVLVQDVDFKKKLAIWEEMAQGATNAKIEVWLDLTESHFDRSTIAKIRKELKNVPEYLINENTVPQLVRSFWLDQQNKKTQIISQTTEEKVESLEESLTEEETRILTPKESKNYDSCFVKKTVKIKLKDYPRYVKVILMTPPPLVYHERLVTLPKSFLIPLEIDLKHNQVYIKSIQIRARNDILPFRFVISRDPMDPLSNWNNQVLHHMDETINQQVVYHQYGMLFEYHNKRCSTILFCGLVYYFYPDFYHTRANVIGNTEQDTVNDIVLKKDPEQMRKSREALVIQIIKAPVTFSISIKYLIPKLIN